jgi:hypothetical protein
MSTLTISLPEERVQELRARATRLGVTAEELARASVEDMLRQPDDDFRRAMDYVLKKNAELYRRLG